jgi:hypothetical protein
MEFQRTRGEQEQLKNESYQRRIEKTDSAMKAMTIEDLLIIKEKYSDDIGITAFVDEFLEERGKSANENQG